MRGEKEKLLSLFLQLGNNTRHIIAVATQMNLCPLDFMPFFLFKSAGGEEVHCCLHQFNNATQFARFGFEPHFLNPSYTGGGGHICPPGCVCVYNCADKRTSTLKHLTFPKYEYGKGQYAFYPVKLSCFAKKKSSSKIL